MAAKPKYSKRETRHVNLGLQEVYPNSDEAPSSRSSKKYSIDIVAIPGLGADPEWTWTWKDPEDPERKVHWLRDSKMLPLKVIDARISVFQYQSQWFGKGAVYQQLDNVADQLLAALHHARGENNKTPIIFVCHCLGGIVLEQALLSARLRQDAYPSIFPSVAGCIFLGTPFNGTQTERKARVLAVMAETIGMGINSGLLKILEDNSDFLRKLVDDFVRLSHEAQIRLFCFFESQKSDLIRLVRKGLPFQKEELIVDKSSAVFLGADSLQLASDHFGLNKFQGPLDGNFVSVSNEIKAVAKKASRIVNARQKALRQKNVDDRTYRTLIDTLGKGFSDLDAAVSGSYRGPKDAKSSWVVKVDGFQKWMEQRAPGLLWIHGKAGTGQGAIASSVIESLKPSKDESERMVASFFCEQSDENRRSFCGMLKIIIRQIIDLNQDLASHLLTDSEKGKNAGKQDFVSDEFNKAPFLWNTLQAIAKSLPEGCIYIVVYGLDQLSKEALETFLRYMREVPGRAAEDDENAETSPIKWMLLSRSGRPDIEKTFAAKAYEIDIDANENSDYRSDALRADISTMVDDLRLPAPLSYFAKRHIHTRAEDNYIYVNLVVQELKNARSSGHGEYSNMRAMLESFPYGLTEMFEHIRKRDLKPQAEGIEHTKEILRCLILAQRAPTLRELAIMADLPRKDRDDLEMLKAYVIRCGAFLTLGGDEADEDNMTVEWIDVSAREHLERFAKDELALEPRDMQHGIIALRCLEYIYSCMEKYEAAEARRRAREAEAVQHEEHEEDTNPEPTSPDNEPEEDGDAEHEEHEDEHEDNGEPNGYDLSDSGETRESEIGEFNLENVLGYPVKFWLQHAKLAPADVIPEFKTGHDFWKDDSPPRQEWWSENDSMHVFDNQTNVSALHVATIAEYPAFVEHLLSWGWGEDIDKEDSLGYQPLFYACSTGNYEIVQMLLGTHADINHVASYEDGNVSALYAAAEHGHVDIVECLIARDADVNGKSMQWGSPLYVACEEDHEAVIRLLLEHEADVNLIGGQRSRPINIAAWNGNLDMVRLLVEKGADIDPDEEDWYGSAVGTASRQGHADVVKFLLSRGWSPNRPMKTYGSFLTCAATYGHVEVVETLVQTEARITVLEQALAAASQVGKAAIVKIILDKTPTLRHQKAFMMAADFGRDEVLRLLFPRGMPQAKLDEALYVAADHEHETTVKLLLEFGASPNAEGPIYGCALTASAYDGTTTILNILLEHGADVNKRAGDYGTPLQAAAWYGDADNVRLLLDRGALVNTEPIGIYGNPLQAACETGDDDTIRLLLERGALVNAHGGKFDYPIIAAVDQGDYEALKILLEHNADVNVSGHSDGVVVPVMALAGSTLTKEHLEAILDHGAKVDAAGNDGVTALMKCAEAGDSEGLEFLISRGASVRAFSEKAGTALTFSAAEGYAECCRVLLDNDADVNAIGGEAGTPLAAAAAAPDLDVVRLLLEHGAAVDTVAGESGTPLQAACAGGDLDVVRELIERDAKVNHRPSNGKYGCALSAALAHHLYDIAVLLLEHDADVHFRGGLHEYPILAAVASASTDDAAVNLLLDHGADATVQGGVYGSAVAAAAFANNSSVMEQVIERGADPRALGGKYGSPLALAAMKATDLSCIDILLDHGVDVNYRGGKYHTALIAASYFDKLDVVERLLDKGADFRFSGGRYGSAVTASAIRGSKSVLERLLKMGPPEHLLDEALVGACAHRQSTSVELLLKSGANVYARTASGTPIDALRAEQADGNNSDDESEDDEEDEEEEDDDDDDDDDEQDEEWEGDGVSVAEPSQQGSVTNLQLEEEITEEAKIQKLLDEAMERVKRNPTIQRFRTVKRGNFPASLKAGPRPQLTPTTSYQQFDPPSERAVQTSSRQFQAYPGYDQATSGYPVQNVSPAPGYAPYRGTVSASPPNPSQGVPTRKPVPGGYQSPPAQYGNGPLPLRQYSNGFQSESPPALPPRMASQEQLAQRYSVQQPGSGPQLNPGPNGRYQQHQPRPSYPGPQNTHVQPSSQQGSNTPPGQNPYASPPQSSYHSPPLYNSPPPMQQEGAPRPQYQSPPPQYQAFNAQPSGQQTGYIPYGQQSQASSQTSFHSQYASTPYSGSQQGSYGTPNSSQTSFGTQGQGQARRWNSGGYDGEGYG